MHPSPPDSSPIQAAHNIVQNPLCQGVRPRWSPRFRCAAGRGRAEVSPAAAGRAPLPAEPSPAAGPAQAPELRLPGSAAPGGWNLPRPGLTPCALHGRRMLTQRAAGDGSVTRSKYSRVCVSTPDSDMASFLSVQSQKGWRLCRILLEILIISEQGAHFYFVAVPTNSTAGSEKGTYRNTSRSCVSGKTRLTVHPWLGQLWIAYSLGQHPSECCSSSGATELKANGAATHQRHQEREKHFLISLPKATWAAWNESSFSSLLIHETRW